MAEIDIILYERRYVLPAARAVGELTKLPRETVERDIGGAIERVISPASRIDGVGGRRTSSDQQPRTHEG